MQDKAFDVDMHRINYLLIGENINPLFEMC
jgi:hypothetical protein